MRGDQLDGGNALLALHWNGCQKKKDGSPTEEAVLGAMMEAEFQAVVIAALKSLFAKKK